MSYFLAVVLTLILMYWWYSRVPPLSEEELMFELATRRFDWELSPDKRSWQCADGTIVYFVSANRVEVCGYPTSDSLSGLAFKQAVINNFRMS
jgi:hypothetical protein